MILIISLIYVNVSVSIIIVDDYRFNKSINYLHFFLCKKKREKKKPNNYPELLSNNLRLNKKNNHDSNSNNIHRFVEWANKCVIKIRNKI